MTESFDGQHQNTGDGSNGKDVVEGQDLPGVSTERLSNADLDALSRRFRDRRPTYPCPTCKGTEWALGACGMGRETWVCKAANDARPIDWDHYGASSRELTSGDEDVLALIAEVRAHRAVNREDELRSAFIAGVAHGFGWTSEQNMVDAVGDDETAATEYAREVIASGARP